MLTSFFGCAPCFVPPSLWGLVGDVNGWIQYSGFTRRDDRRWQRRQRVDKLDFE